MKKLSIAALLLTLSYLNEISSQSSLVQGWGRWINLIRLAHIGESTQRIIRNIMKKLALVAFLCTISYISSVHAQTQNVAALVNAVKSGVTQMENYVQQREKTVKQQSAARAALGVPSGTSPEKAEASAGKPFTLPLSGNLQPVGTKLTIGVCQYLPTYTVTAFPKTGVTFTGQAECGINFMANQAGTTYIGVYKPGNPVPVQFFEVNIIA